MRVKGWQRPDLLSLPALKVRKWISIVLGTIGPLYLIFSGLVWGAGGRWQSGFNLALALLAIAVVAWWAASGMALVQQLQNPVRLGIEERVQVLEQKNRQLQIILQAFRAMSVSLDLPRTATACLEQIVQHTSFRKAAMVLGPDDLGNFTMAGAVGLSDEYTSQLLEALRGPQKASSPVEWCQLTRQPVVVDSLSRDFRTAGLRELYGMENLEGMIAVPLFCHEQFRGVAMVYTEKGQTLTTSDISLISALAKQATITVENARQYTAAVQGRARMDQALRLLENVAASLARTRIGVQPLMHLVAQTAATLYAPARVKLMINKAGRQAPIVVTEAAGVEPLEEDRLALSLPVSLDGENFGRLDVSLPGPGRTLDADEVRVLQSFAYLAASALGNGALVVEMRQAVEEMERSYIGTLEALSKALEMRDHETEGHSRRVVQYTMSLAQKLGVPEEKMIPVLRGALLHDVGKIGIPDAILRKPGPLTDAERAVMREHPRIGYEMLRDIGFLSAACPVILHHHERFDGKGYPEGLASDQIPLGARIFAVADSYDAITSDRPYRKGRPHEQAVAEIVAGSGTQFDPAVVEAFLALPLQEMDRIRGRGMESAS